MYHCDNSCNSGITRRHVLWWPGCTLSQHPRLHAIPSHAYPRQAYRDSSGISPLQARHIKMPPTRARPPATQPTNRAEPKVYLQNTETQLVSAATAVQSAAAEMHWTLSFSLWPCRSSHEHHPHLQAHPQGALYLTLELHEQRHPSQFAWTNYLQCRWDRDSVNHRIIES